MPPAHCYSVLAIYHKMYKTPERVCFMEDNVSYTIDKGEISHQKMQLLVISRRPQYLHHVKENIRYNIEKQLFEIFQKYV